MVVARHSLEDAGKDAVLGGKVLSEVLTAPWMSGCNKSTLGMESVPPQDHPSLYPSFLFYPLNDSHLPSLTKCWLRAPEARDLAHLLHCYYISPWLLGTQWVLYKYLLEGEHLE